MAKEKTAIKREFASKEEQNQFLADPLIQALDNKAYNIQMISVPINASLKNGKLDFEYSKEVENFLKKLHSIKAIHAFNKYGLTINDF